MKTESGLEGHGACRGENKVYTFFWEGLRGGKPLGKPGNRWRMSKWVIRK
jgi:hypothetical protein